MRLRGPESQLDWLGVAMLWLGAFILALREGSLPLPTGAPAFLASGVWNLIPLLLISAAIAIFIWRVFHPLAAAAPLGAPVAAPPPSGPVEQDLTPRDKALLDLQNVRYSIDAAVDQRDDEYAGTVFHEVEAVMLTIKREFGVGLLKGANGALDAFGYKEVLRIYGQYIDRFYPMLRQGHVDAAKAKAARFKWIWGE